MMKGSDIYGPTDRKQAVRILAKSLFRELRSQGYDEGQIVDLASSLVSEVTEQINKTGSN